MKDPSKNKRPDTVALRKRVQSSYSLKDRTNGGTTNIPITKSIHFTKSKPFLSITKSNPYICMTRSKTSSSNKTSKTNINTASTTPKLILTTSNSQRPTHKKQLSRTALNRKPTFGLKLTN